MSGSQQQQEQPQGTRTAAVIGTTSWGTTLALCCSRGQGTDHSSLWSRTEETAQPDE